MSTDYDLLAKQFAALADESDRLALTANFIALLYSAMPDINWLGVYVRRGDELVLGPFQGLVACTRIEWGQGVCGTAAASGTTQRVDDVHQFAGHIACDPASNAELVVPLKSNNEVFAVLDIDSPVPARFTAGDQAGVERLCGEFVAALESATDPLRDFI